MVAEALSDRSAKDTKSAVINQTLTTPGAGASTTFEVIPLVAGKRIVVTNVNHMHIHAAFGSGDSTIGIIFKSASTALTGDIRFANIEADEGEEMTINTSYMPDGHFKTAAGEALNATINDHRGSGGATGNVFIRGYVNYYEE